MSCLPSLPRTSGDGALIVIVSILPQDSREALEDVIRGDIDRWPNDPVFVYCLDNLFQQQLEQIGRDGNIGQIYNIATNASALGWKQLIIVDALSREQLTGSVRPGRSEAVSVVFVQVDKTTGDGIYGKLGGEINVMARRMHINDATDALREQKPISFKIPRNNEAQVVTPQDYFEEGLLLYDPFRAIYDKRLSSNETPDEIGRAVDQVLSLEPPLPPEIATKITAYAHEELDLEKMTAAPAKFSIDVKRLDIHLLVPMDTKEVEFLQESYNEKLRGSSKSTTCVVYPWLASRSANRLELWCLFQRLCQKNYSSTYTVFLFVGWPGWQKDAEVGLMQWNYNVPPPTRRVPIEKAAELWDAVYHRGSPYFQSNTCADYSDPAFELMLDPRERFFFDPPPFVSLVKDTFTAPVFNLTKHITRDEMSSIRKKLYSPSEYENSFEFVKDYAFVEWQSDADGTVEDMWRLLWQCHLYRGHGCTDAAIFIDKQSASDHKVIIADIMYHAGESDERVPVQDDEYGPYTGIQYGRQPAREATIVWVNLAISNMSIGELFEDGSAREEGEVLHKYFRPGVIWRSSETQEQETQALASQ